MSALVFDKTCIKSEGVAITNIYMVDFLVSLVPNEGLASQLMK